MAPRSILAVLVLRALLRDIQAVQLEATCGLCATNADSLVLLQTSAGAAPGSPVHEANRVNIAHGGAAEVTDKPSKRKGLHGKMKKRRHAVAHNATRTMRRHKKAGLRKAAKVPKLAVKLPKAQKAEVQKKHLMNQSSLKHGVEKTSMGKDMNTSTIARKETNVTKGAKAAKVPQPAVKLPKAQKAEVQNKTLMNQSSLKKSVEKTSIGKDMNSTMTKKESNVTKDAKAQKTEVQNKTLMNQSSLKKSVEKTSIGKSVMNSTMTKKESNVTKDAKVAGAVALAAKPPTQPSTRGSAVPQPIKRAPVAKAPMGVSAAARKQPQPGAQRSVKKAEADKVWYQSELRRAGDVMEEAETMAIEAEEMVRNNVRADMLAFAGGIGLNLFLFCGFIFCVGDVRKATVVRGK